MIRVIVLTQLIFVAIGSFALVVMDRSRAVQSFQDADLRNFLVSNALWMLLVPFVWAFLARLALFASAKPRVLAAIQASGVLLSVLLAATYIWLVLSF